MEAQQCVQLTGTNRSSDFNALINRWPGRAHARRTTEDRRRTTDKSLLVQSSVVRPPSSACFTPSFLAGLVAFSEVPKTRSHPELGRQTPQRPWYCVSRPGRVGRRQARQERSRETNDRVKPGQTPDPSTPAKPSPIHSITIVTCFRISDVRPPGVRRPKPSRGGAAR